MKVCDVCGSETPYLSQLRDEYQGQGLKEVCEKCESDFNSAVRKVRLIVGSLERSWVRRAVTTLIKRRRGK